MLSSGRHLRYNTLHQIRVSIYASRSQKIADLDHDLVHVGVASSKSGERGAELQRLGEIAYA